MTTIYKVLTPYGAFQAAWADDEESQVEYTGSTDAIAHFKAFLDLNSISGVGGALVQFDSLEPADLYGFCQSEVSGITVLPSVDDMMDEIESEEMTTNTVLDAVSPAEAFTLIGEGAQILARLSEDADTFFADLGRLRDIVQALEDAPGVADQHAEARAYLQSVIEGTADLSDLATAEEMRKIHTASASDADMLALFKTAVNAYSSYAIAQADAALNKG